MIRSQFLPTAGDNATPDVTVENRALRPRQLRIALATILIPFAGSVAAIGLAVRDGSVSWLNLGLLVGGFTLTTIGLDVGFHRAFAHRAFVPKRWLRAVLGVLGSMGAQGRVLYWVASHRRHHAHSDTPNDPHSPHMRRIDDREEAMGFWKGLWHAHIGHMVTDRITNCTLFARDLSREPLMLWLNARYGWLVLSGLLLPAAIGGLATMSWYGALTGLLWGGLFRMFLVHQTTWAVASVCHLSGARPFAAGDHSANNFWIAIPSMGSAFQNNHHAFPTSAMLGLRWYEVDLAGWVIRGFCLFGMASDMRRPTRAQMEQKRVDRGGTADEIITVC